MNRLERGGVFFALIDTYQRTMHRKQEEIAKLSADLAKEQAKITPLQKKIISAESAIRKTKSTSIIDSKHREIERSNKAIANSQDKCGKIQTQIAKKEKERMTAEKNYRNEAAKLQKKNSEAEKKRQKEAERQVANMEKSLRMYESKQRQMQMDIEELKYVPEKITVLFLAANPTGTLQLLLDEEARAIHEKIRMSEYRDSIEFSTRWATRASDVLQAINETNPTIIHFSGHGDEDGNLVLLNPDGSANLVSKEAITMAMTTASDTIRLVVFNACFSEIQAMSVVENIEAAIGMADSISDDTAIIFAAQLYSSIGFGRSLRQSFNQAKAELLLEGIPEEYIPQLYCRDDIDPDTLILVRP